MNECRYHSGFFQNRDCEFFPCHKGISEESFNCLFCYCPLYALGKQCGGHFVYNTHGNKVCKNCTFPHKAENYDKILARYPEIMRVVKRVDGEDK